MDQYKKLSTIFELSTVNIDKANRSTLLKYATRTKFQKRREAFYSQCKDGKKSKVAICKSENRPTWVHNLETLKTKQLRNQLRGFLKELGILQKPSKKLAKEKNWKAVIHLFDDAKTGAGLSDDEAEDRDRGRRSRVVLETPAVARPRRRAPPSQSREPSEEYDEGFEEGGFEPPRHDPLAVLHQDMSQLLKDGKLTKAGLSKLSKDSKLDETLTKLTTLLQNPPLAPPAALPTPVAQGGGVLGRIPEETRVEVIKTGKNCYFIDEDENCVCPPHRVKVKEMSKQTKKKLKTLAEHKQLTCSKINLLRCLCVEFDTQTKLWKKFNANCQGDFLSDMTAKQVKELKCGKDAVFSGPDLHSMKSVAQCYNLSQNLCKGHKDSMARFKDPEAIDSEFTLGHLCYDELLANVRKFNDPWSRAAYQNRIPDPKPAKMMYCEKEDGEVQIVDVAAPPPAFKYSLPWS